MCVCVCFRSFDVRGNNGLETSWNALQYLTFYSKKLYVDYLFLMALSLLRTYISYTPIATAQKRNKLTLAPPWDPVDFELNSSAGNDYR